MHVKEQDAGFKAFFTVHALEKELDIRQD